MEDEEYANNKQKIIETMISQQRIVRNSKYGEFIIQSNEVQFYLVFFIKLTATKINKKLSKDVEGSTLGTLINYFQLCIKTEDEKLLIGGLLKYNESRNSLAHKMFTDKMLTERECNVSIELGDTLLTILKELIAQKVKKYGFIKDDKDFLYKR